jgi:hypothetical protein
LLHVQTLLLKSRICYSLRLSCLVPPEATHLQGHAMGVMIIFFLRRSHLSGVELVPRTLPLLVCLANLFGVGMPEPLAVGLLLAEVVRAILAPVG